MDRHAAEGSRLPSFMLPCPSCADRMVLKSVEHLTSSDLEDITYTCQHCGTELVRTVKPIREAI